MTSRTRFLITAALVCHLLLAPPVVTSQLLSAAGPTAAQSSLPSTPSAVREQDVTIRALQQEKDGAVFKLRGQAEIRYSTYILYADAVDYDSDTGDAIADGHVVLDGGTNDEHVEAAHGTYNIRAETGRFEHVVGTTGMRLQGRRRILTSPNPFAFTGKVVEKPSPDHYVVYDGTITTCELPRPKWEFNAHKIVVEVGGNATIYRSTFRIRGVPILYFPFATYPVERLPRQSGLLIPNVGNSSIKGTILGESVFWAINRSMDITAGVEYFTRRGWAPRAEFRARPSEDSYVDLNYSGVFDRGVRANEDQGGHEVRLNAEDAFGHGFRGVVSIDYLSTFVFRLAFNDVFSQAVNSEVKSEAFLSNATRGFFYNGSTQRYQNFESTTPGDVVTILHAPSFESSSVDHKLGHSPLYWSYEAAAEGLSRSEPSFRTAPLVGRFDFSPTLSLPLLLHGWSLRPELSLRETFYTQRLVPSTGVGVAESDLLNRKALEGSVEIRPPALERFFDREFLGRKWKHVIEPRATYRYVTGINNFARILRFDERDILSNTNEVEYALVNRLYAKRTSENSEDCDSSGMSSLIIGRPVAASRIPWESQSEDRALPCQAGPPVREIITWELAQKYFLDPTFGGALVPGQRNVFTTTADFTGIAFLTDARRLSPLISRLRFQATSRTEAEWDIDFDFKKSRINASTAFVNYRFGSYTIGGGDAYLQAPSDTLAAATVPQAFNQFRLLFGYGYPNKRGFSGAANLGFDANLGFLQYSAVQMAYNWDCCGLSVEYRRFALGSVRNENQFRFNFALANIGAIGNLRRQEKLF